MDIKKRGIEVELIGTVETNVDKYGKTHIVVLYKYKKTILAWPTVGVSKCFEHMLNKKVKITFSELDRFFIEDERSIKRISYVRTL